PSRLARTRQREGLHRRSHAPAGWRAHRKRLRGQRLPDPPMSHSLTPALDLLDRRVEAARRFFPGQFGFAARNLRTGEEVRVDGDMLFPTASTYKVPVLIEVYRQEAAGILALDETIPFTEENRRLGSGVMRDLS